MQVAKKLVPYGNRRYVTALEQVLTTQMRATSPDTIQNPLKCYLII